MILLNCVFQQILVPSGMLGTRTDSTVGERQQPDTGTAPQVAVEDSRRLGNSNVPAWWSRRIVGHPFRRMIGHPTRTPGPERTRTIVGRARQRLTTGQVTVRMIPSINWIRPTTI